MIYCCTRTCVMIYCYTRTCVIIYYYTSPCTTICDLYLYKNFMYGNVSQYMTYKAIYEFDIFADVIDYRRLLQNGKGAYI